MFIYSIYINTRVIPHIALYTINKKVKDLAYMASFIATQLSRPIDTYSNQYSVYLCDPYYYLLTFQLIVVSPPSISALATLVLYSTTLDHIEP